jgi:Tfp pilus assembly protein PilZ
MLLSDFFTTMISGGMVAANIQRRKHRWIHFEAFISHDILSDEVVHTDKMFNFSKDGLYFESDQNIEPGDDIYIGIGYPPHRSSDNIQLLFGVEVVWRKDLKNSPYHYGFGTKFINPGNSFVKTIDIADSLMKKAETTGIESESLQGKELKVEMDSRKHPRKSCRKLLTFTAKNHDCNGLVTNISRGGAFIETGSRLSLGAIINLIIVENKRHKYLRVRGWVVRVAAQGVGVSFDRRSGKERRYDLDRRTGLDRRKGGNASKPVN